MAMQGLRARIIKLMRGLLYSALALAVIGALLWFGNVHQMLALIERFQQIYVLWFMFLLLAYEIVRGLLWYVLLQSLIVRVPARTQLFAFTIGEVAKFVPTGAYAQNYILQRSKGADFGRTSAATTLIIVAEIAIALVGVVLLGEGTWSLGLRLAIVVIVALLAALLWVYRMAPHVVHVPPWMARNKRLRWAMDEFRRFRAGAATLLHPRTMAITMGLTAGYVFCAGAALYAVVAALGIGSVSFWQVQAVNCFGLAFYVILGSLEAADVGVLIGLGLSKSAAVSVILVNRALGVGGTIMFAAVALAVLRQEWRPLLRGPERPQALAAAPQPAELPPAQGGPGRC